MRPNRLNLNIKTAEKLFNRKASPDTKLSIKDFLKKKKADRKLK